MKKIIFYILTLVSIFGISCMKDKTNLDLTPITSIVIDTAGVPNSFDKLQLDSLKLKIKVSKEGSAIDDFKYEWRINNFGGYKRIVSTSVNLATKITEAPGTYALIVTVTDPNTNQKAFFSWVLAVSSPYGAGLIVADTRDGINSDYNLIRAANFTPGNVLESKIFRDLYSSANSQKIEGIVKGMSYMKYFSNPIMTGVTDRAIIRVDPLSYKFTMRDNQCFLLPPAQISPGKIQSIQTVNQHEYIVNNGKVHSRYGSAASFGYQFLTDKLDYTCSNVCGLENPVAAGAVLYDEKNNRFLLTPTATSNTAPLTVFPTVDNGGTAPAFDPANMGNKTCLQLEEGQNNRVLAVMKDRTAPNYFVYQVTLAPISGKMGYSLNDLSNNPEIGSSKFYTCSSLENVLFYATEDHVYSSSLLVNGGSVPALRYTVESGEKITGMQMHRMQGNMYLPSLTAPQDFSKKGSWPSANRMLILSTYNEGTKNGKIITIPLETLGVGGLITDPLYINTYSGFGRITAFCNQNP
jgi:hypothetical protein